MNTTALSEMVGMIEIGSTSVRAAVAQRQGRRAFHLLSQLNLPIGLGRDAFTSEWITTENTERCVQAVRDFRDVLSGEFGLAPRQVRMVATSAVREARNREQFIDRIRIATGLQVQVLDEAEVSRLTYLAVRPQLRRLPDFLRTNILVVEVGGGSTDILLFRRGRVTASHVYRLGALRMVHEIGDTTLRASGILGVLYDYVSHTVEQIVAAIHPATPLRMVVLGGEPRMLCNLNARDETDAALTPLPIEAVEHAARTLVPMRVEDIGRQWGMTLHQAETMGPSLLIYGAIARALDTPEMLVSSASLRHGVLTDQLYGEDWVDEFRRQTISSATALARHFRVDLRHARRIAHYARAILRFMQNSVAFSAKDEVILTVASLLHEAGMFVSARAYHKHTHYLIAHSDIFGLGAHDTMLAAYVARYHRRASPRPTHDDFQNLPTEDRIRISKLSAILRIADCLDFDEDAGPVTLSFAIAESTLQIRARTHAPLSLAQRQVDPLGEMFQQVYGLRVLLLQDPGAESA